MPLTSALLTMYIMSNKGSVYEVATRPLQGRSGKLIPKVHDPNNLRSMSWYHIYVACRKNIQLFSVTLWFGDYLFPNIALRENNPKFVIQIIWGRSAGTTYRWHVRKSSLYFPNITIWWFLVSQYCIEVKTNPIRSAATLFFEKFRNYVR
jgi:hypothetical protein